MEMTFKKTRFGSIEPFVFYAIIIFNASVLFATKYFPTYDGGAHAYNVNIIHELLFNKDSVYHEYFQLSPEILPNWISYVILLLLKPFVTFDVAEKIILLIFFLCVPLAFRSNIRSFKNTNILLSYLIFPFTQFSLLYMGFFNFTLGVLFFMATIKVYLSLKDSFELRSCLLLFLCFGLTYFSHLFAFLSELIFIMIHSFLYLIINFKALKRSNIWKWMALRACNILIPGALFIAFTITYFAKRPPLGIDKFLSFEELNAFIFEITSLRAFGGAETPYINTLFYLLFALFVSSFYKRITEYRKEDGLVSIFNINDAFLFTGLLFIYFIYTQPNEDGYVGMISIRLTYYMFLFFIFWIATQSFSNRIVLPILMVYLFLSYQLFELKKSGQKFTNDQVKKLDEPMKLIQPNSLVMEAYFANHYLWQGLHYVDYIGANNSIVVLDNYEAEQGHFPVMWNESRLPQVTLGDVTEENSCLLWKTGGKEKQKKKADYFLLYGEQPDNECYKATIEDLEQGYSLIYKIKDVRLYKLKASL
jgi:hypothetical protein